MLFIDFSQTKKEKKFSAPYLTPKPQSEEEDWPEDPVDWDKSTESAAQSVGSAALKCGLCQKFSCITFGFTDVRLARK